MTVAWELGTTKDEILALSADEFAEWIAFFKWVYSKKPTHTHDKRKRKGVPTTAL